jgi:hypothetical protein
MKLSEHNIILIIFCSIASIFFDCIENDNNTFNNNPIDDTPAIVEDILQFIDVREYKNILIISRFTCHSCFRAVTERASTEAKMNPVHIIILGANLTEVKRLNAIYQRFNLSFLFIDENIYVRLADSNPEFAHTIFLGVRVDEKGAMILYDGKEDYDDIEQRTNAVIDFLFNEPALIIH